MLAGAYNLHLYCDVPDCANATCQSGQPPFESVGCETFGEAKRQAREVGWVIGRNSVRCPDHRAHRFKIHTTPGDEDE